MVISGAYQFLAYFFSIMESGYMYRSISYKVVTDIIVYFMFMGSFERVIYVGIMDAICNLCHYLPSMMNFAATATCPLCSTF